MHTSRVARASVLVVDDEKNIRGSLSRALRVEDFDGDVAGSGRLALERVAAKTYEVTKTNGRRFTWSQTRSLEELEKLRERYATPTGEPEDGCAICHL